MEKPMTAQEQGIEVAQRYLNGGKLEREIILSCFTDEEKETFLKFVHLYKLFTDQRYYDAVKHEVCNQIMKEIYG